MATITLYNTATRNKETFQPIDPSRIRMYVCGPTVYDRAHIGNARPVVVFDLLYRLLRRVYGADHVTYVRNITDVDDKINARAAESGRAIRDITEETLGWFIEDMAALGADYRDQAQHPHFVGPRATEHIAEMIDVIERLIGHGAAYAAEGHVLFSVSAYDDYGALSGRSLEDMLAGARVDVAPYKRDPMDFVLWKPSTGDTPGWDSPWGYGRPGWHIECSGMARKYLGDDFDIHGGGIDLTFPHHENERAQSLCAHPGTGFARVWMHNGFVQVEGEKMSKSLGNFITVHDLRDQVPGEVIRFAMLMTQYRQPFDWTQTLAEEARTVLTRWRKGVAGAVPGAVPDAVLAALCDDLNTPKAIAEMHQLAGAGDWPALLASAQLVGLLTPELGAWAEAPAASAEVTARIEALAEALQAARAAKDFQTSDAIRDGLIAAGVEVRISKAGVDWSLTAGFDAAALPALA